MEARLTDNFAQAVTDELTEWNGKGRAIVYAPFKKRAKAIRKWLKASGFKGVGLYTGDCNDKKRHKAMNRFQSGKTRVMVATSAFGLGINFPNVRLVIHAGLPFSMDEYAQECGRGSRDGKKARCVLFFSDKDYDTNREFLTYNNDSSACKDALRRLKPLRKITKSDTCLWQAIEGYFGEKPGEPCGNCAACRMKKATNHAKKRLGK